MFVRTVVRPLLSTRNDQGAGERVLHERLGGEVVNEVVMTYKSTTNEVRQLADGAVQNYDKRITIHRRQLLHDLNDIHYSFYSRILASSFQFLTP